jgi:hypothetical protein
VDFKYQQKAHRPLLRLAQIGQPTPPLSTSHITWMDDFEPTDKSECQCSHHDHSLRLFPMLGQDREAFDEVRAAGGR